MIRHIPTLFLSFILCLPQAYAQTKSQYRPSSKIMSWEKVVIKKDFILSNSLMNHRFCRKVWDYQIGEFKKRNPQVKDVNKFEVGDIVELQLCTDFKFTQFSEPQKAEVSQSFVPLSEANKDSNLKGTTLSDSKPEQMHDTAPVVSNAVDDLYNADFTLLGTFGTLAEQDDKVQASFGFRVIANVNQRIGYRMRLDYATTVLMWHNEVLLQTLPSVSGTRYYLGYGLGNRMGIKENLLNVNLSNKNTGYTTLSLGTNFKVGRGLIDFQVGSNISNYFAPFVSIIASKRLGDSPYTLGGFIDYRSTKGSKEATDEDRHWVGAGLLFSY